MDSGSGGRFDARPLREVGVKLVTWNVNSVRARQERLFAWLRRHQPDVLCLQELKVETDKFPRAELEALGYRAAVHGQKTYNGVAILSPHPLDDVTTGFDDGDPDPQARFITAKVGGIRIANGYFPNGGDLGSDKFAYKLRWWKRLRAWLDAHVRIDEPFALLGDYNVAPDTIDVQNPAAWVNTPMHDPDSRAAMRDTVAFGLHDAVRHVRKGEPGLYSWWDYRNLGFQKNDGLRIDHVFVTEPLLSRVVGASVDREERKGAAPSDHAPVVVTLSE